MPGFGEPQGCPAAEQCATTLASDIEEANGLDDKVERLQARCLSLTSMVRCMCSSCAAATESDENFINAHTEFCSPAMRVQFHEAGGGSHLILWYRRESLCFSW